ncbi:MAG: hypothetical protein H6723_12135 [Sandaracinus sp.]|nr:hypothetical protein [Sandaracinus sp.]
MRHIPWLLGCLLLGCSSDATPPVDVETFCADLAAYEGVEVNLEFRIDPSLVLRFGSSGALCGETMPCCNTAQYVYLLPGCNGERVALSGSSSEFPALFCESRGGNEGTFCAQCNTAASQSVIGVRGVLGAQSTGLLDGEPFRALDVTEVRFATR